MKRLAEIQSLIKEAIVSPRLKPETGVLDLFPESGTRTPEKQISIYRQTVRSNLFGALKDSYPACCNVVGEDYFKQIAADYFQKFPPDEPDLNDYGDKLEQYLEELIQIRPEASSLFYLPELARLEWSWYLLSFKEEGFSKNLVFRYPVHLIWDFSNNPTEEKISLVPDSYLLRFSKSHGKRKLSLNSINQD